MAKEVSGNIVKRTPHGSKRTRAFRVCPFLICAPCLLLSKSNPRVSLRASPTTSALRGAGFDFVGDARVGDHSAGRITFPSRADPKTAGNDQIPILLFFEFGSWPARDSDPRRGRWRLSRRTRRVLRKKAKAARGDRPRAAVLLFGRAHPIYSSRFESCLTSTKARTKTTSTKTTKVVEKLSVSLTAM